MPEPIRVAVVFPELLGTYGDRGNAEVLAWRLRARGHPAEVVDVPASAPIPAGMDAYVLGGGEDLAQAAAARRLHGRAGDGLRQAIADDTPVLAVCGSLQLLGHVYLNGAGQAVPGLGLLDLETAAVGPRCVGEVVARLPDGTLLSGFENHAGRSRLGPQAAPLATVLRGNGNNGSDGSEGARRGNLLATYLHGPVLVRNPALADALCAAVLARRGHPGPLAPLDPDPATALHLERLRASEPRRGDGLRRPRRRRRQPRG